MASQENARKCAYGLDLGDLEYSEMDLAISVPGKLCERLHTHVNRQASDSYDGMLPSIRQTATASDNRGNSPLSSASTITTPTIHPIRTPPDAPPTCMAIYLHAGFPTTATNGFPISYTCPVTGAGIRTGSSGGGGGGGGTRSSFSVFNSEDDKEEELEMMNSNTELHSSSQLTQSGRRCSRKDLEKQDQALPPALLSTPGNKCGTAAASPGKPSSSKTCSKKRKSTSTTAHGMPLYASAMHTCASAASSSSSTDTAHGATVSDVAEEECLHTKRQTPASKHDQPPLSSPSASATHAAQPGFATAARWQHQLLSRAGGEGQGWGVTAEKVKVQDKTVIASAAGATSQKKSQPQRVCVKGGGTSHGHGPNQAQVQKKNLKQEMPFQYPPLGMIAMAMQNAREEREWLKSRKAKAKKST